MSERGFLVTLVVIAATDIAMFAHHASKLDTYEPRTVTEVIDRVGNYNSDYYVSDGTTWHKLSYYQGIRRPGDRFHVVHHESWTGQKWTTATP